MYNLQFCTKKHWITLCSKWQFVYLFRSVYICISVGWTRQDGVKCSFSLQMNVKACKPAHKVQILAQDLTRSLKEEFKILGVIWAPVPPSEASLALEGTALLFQTIVKAGWQDPRTPNCLHAMRIYRVDARWMGCRTTQPNIHPSPAVVLKRCYFFSTGFIELYPGSSVSCPADAGCGEFKLVQTASTSELHLVSWLMLGLCFRLAGEDLWVVSLWASNCLYLELSQCLSREGSTHL